MRILEQDAQIKRLILAGVKMGITITTEGADADEEDAVYHSGRSGRDDGHKSEQGLPNRADAEPGAEGDGIHYHRREVSGAVFREALLWATGR